jgi:hypothetical protein
VALILGYGRSTSYFYLLSAPRVQRVDFACVCFSFLRTAVAGEIAGRQPQADSERCHRGADLPHVGGAEDEGTEVVEDAHPKSTYVHFCKY